MSGLTKQTTYRICDRMSIDQKSDLIKHMYSHMSISERIDMWKNINGICYEMKRRAPRDVCISCNDEFQTYNTFGEVYKSTCDECHRLIHRIRPGCSILLTGITLTKCNKNNLGSWSWDNMPATRICKSPSCIEKHIHQKSMKSCGHYVSNYSTKCSTCGIIVCGHANHHPNIYYENLFGNTFKITQMKLE